MSDEGRGALVRRYRDLAPETADRIVEVLSPYVSPARAERIERALASRTRDLVLVLEDVASEHNASAVLRTAEAFGVLEVHVVPRTSAFQLSRKVSIGSHKWLELTRHAHPAEAYAALRARGYAVWASDVHGEARSLEELPVDRKLALVFGNEHQGCSPEAVEAADGRFVVPMTGFVESLNISVACAICTYDLLARRRRAGLLGGLTAAETRRLRATWYTLSVRSARQLLVRAGLEVPRMSDVAPRFGDDL